MDRNESPGGGAWGGGFNARLDTARKSAGEIVADAYSHFDNGDIHRAENMVRDVLRRDATNVDALILLGIIARHTGHSDAALEIFQYAVKTDPRSVESLVNLGNVYQEKGLLKESVACYNEALSIDPDHVDANYNRGCAMNVLGDAAVAVEDFEKAIAQEPDFALAHFNRAQANLALGKTDEAMKDYETSCKIDPGIDDAFFYLGALTAQNGDDDAAKKYFDTLRKNTGEDLDHRVDSWAYALEKRTDNTRFVFDAQETLKLALDATDVDGLMLEFGVLNGNSINFIARHTPQTVYGFDSFEGLPEQWAGMPEGQYSTGGNLPQVADNVELVVGWFKDTLPGFFESHKDPVRFANIDCDLYSSTKTVMDCMADNVTRGTVLVFDEYFMHPGWRDDEFKAFQEAVKANGWTYEYLAFNLITKQAVIKITGV